MKVRVPLGSWTCPSGNSVDAFFRYDEAGVERVDLAWDDPPPLLPLDDAFYTSVILPGVVRGVLEMQGRPGGQVLLVLAGAIS
jgi:hypothetical protein